AVEVAPRDARRGDALPPAQVALARARLDAQRIRGERDPAGAVALRAGGGGEGGHWRPFYRRYTRRPGHGFESRPLSLRAAGLVGVPVDVGDRPHRRGALPARGGAAAAAVQDLSRRRDAAPNPGLSGGGVGGDARPRREARPLADRRGAMAD